MNWYLRDSPVRTVCKFGKRHLLSEHFPGAFRIVANDRAQGYDLLQERDELTAGMAGSGFAVDATSSGMERCI
jgi:hypothetical protein